MPARRPTALTRGLGCLTLAATAVLGAALPAGATAAGHRVITETCLGKRATIVVTGNNKTVRVPKKAGHAVVVATGKGDRVYGNDAGDYLCVGAARSVTGGKGADHISFVSGLIHGGAGNDTITQHNRGNATVYGDAGNDAITLSAGTSTVYGGDGNDTLRAGTSGTDKLYGGNGHDNLWSGGATALMDGGSLGDAYHVAGNDPARKRTIVVPAVGDTVNGGPVRVEAPLTAPSAVLTYAGQQGSAVAPTYPLATAIDGKGPALTIADALAPAGRRIVAWAVDFGDGTPVLLGTKYGLPPASLTHAYVTDGLHVITVTLTDNGGSTTAETLPVTTATAPTGGVTASLSGTVGTFAVTAQAGAGAAFSAYSLDFGDGASANGSTAPPAQLTHDYQTPGDYAWSLTAADDHGSAVTLATGELDVRPSGEPAAVLKIGRTVPLVLPTTIDGPGLFVGGDAGRTVEIGQAVTADVSGSVTSGGGDPQASVDYGDGRPVWTGAASAFPGDFSYGAPGTYTVKLDVTQRGLTTASESATVTVVPAATTATLTAPGTAGEGLLPVTAAATATPGQYIAGWELSSPEGDVVGNGPLPSLSALRSAGAYAWQLRVRDSLGGLATAAAATTVTGWHTTITNFGPSGVGVPADYLTHAATVQPAGTVIVGSGRRLTGAEFSYGDGTVLVPATVAGGVLTVPSHTYAKPGAYLETLTVRDSSGAPTLSSFTVDVSGPPTVQVGEEDQQLPGQPTAFTLGTTPGTGAKLIGWRADFGDGTPAVGGWGAPPPELLHTFASGGSKTVTVEVIDDHGGTDTDTATVIVPKL